MNDSIDCVGALSEIVTELTRNGDTQAITRILPYLEVGRRLKLLHEWELAAIIEVSNMKFDDQKQLLANMKKPVTVCKMISI